MRTMKLNVSNQLNPKMQLVTTLFGPIKFLHYLGLVPYYDRTFKRTKVIPAINLLVYFILQGAAIWHVFKTFHVGHSGNTKLVLQIVLWSLMVSLNLEIITGTGGRYVRGYKDVFNSFAKFDATIKPNPVKYLTVKLVILYIALLVFIICDCISWGIFKGVNTDLFIMNTYFQMLFIYGSVFVMCALLWSILSRCRGMNIALKAFGGGVEELDAFIEAQEVMHVIVEEFNEIYGKAMLLIIGFMIANTLTAVNAYIELFSDQYYFRQLCFWLCFVYIPSLIIIYFCEQILKQGNETTVVTFRLIKKYQNAVGIRQGLYILLQQTINLAPRFSAAGFFDVNFATFFAFLNIIAAYVVVVIQFSHKLDDVT